jgi:pilus assembly protein FimV
VRSSRIKLHANRALGAQHFMTHRSSWSLGALASAMVLLGSLSIHPAHALGLGRITVQSALGEALRAEIEVPEISADEASSLRVGVATAAAFKAAGLDYSAAVVGIQINLQKRADGRTFLSLSSPRPVTEPFVDLILEASWTSGRIVRDYTMLFDPPNLRQAPAATAVAPTAPILSRPSTPFNPTTPPPAASTAQRAAAPAAQPAPNGQQVTVKSGDTAGVIAAQNKPASISLDQMLVALLKSNPDAFIGANVNRLKSGAVLDMPTPEDAAALSPFDASRTIAAQSKDFNDYRRKLASSVPAAQVESANRQSGGKVQAKVEDRAPAAAGPDKLQLSKGALQGKAAADDKIARDKQANEASARVAELAKNIGDLNKIAGQAPSAPGAAASATAKPPGLIVPAAPVLSAPTVAAPLAAASAASPSVANTTVASATPTNAAPVAPADASSRPAASAPVVGKKPVVAAPPPPLELSLMDELTNNPLVLPGVGALLALLAGFWLYRFKKHSDQAAIDSSFLESRLQPDSFFGASGGQRIDTSEGTNGTGSSMVYSPSQLDAAGDVDPVAEADVYLAYGRDLQAEEILKEALRNNPTRIAIHAKLMEIYAKRRDLKAFETMASEAFSLTYGNGPEWAYICELGRDLDPNNPLYQPGGEPEKSERLAAHMTSASAGSFGAVSTPPMMAASPGAADSGVDFDLDLDFSVDDAPVMATQPASAPAPVDTPPKPTMATQVAAAPSAPSAPSAAATASNNSLSFNVDPLRSQPVAAPAPSAAMDSGMLEFDLGSLSLDLNGPASESPTLAPATAAPAPVEGPLETKFALAEEFRALGDSDGARSLASEVVAQAQGSLKTKAQAFLNALS